MKTTIVRIGGQDIEIPNHEIPALISSLTNTYRELLLSGAASAAPQEGYLSYDECQEFLAVLYSDRTLRLHAGNLWGAMCRVTRFGALHFDTLCAICGQGMEESGRVGNKRCHHNVGSIGYRMILIARHSIITNRTQFIEGDFRQIGKSIKSDYRYIVNELSK